MRRYIVTYRTSDGNLRERQVEAKNHLAAAKTATADGLIVVSVDRDDDERNPLKRKHLKRFFGALLVGLLIAIAFVAAFWWRYAQ